MKFPGNIQFRVVVSLGFVLAVRDHEAHVRVRCRKPMDAEVLSADLAFLLVMITKHLHMKPREHLRFVDSTIALLPLLSLHDMADACMVSIIPYTQIFTIGERAA